MATAKAKPVRKPIKLPERILFDSGVVIRALEHANPSRKNDPRIADCRALWVRALRECRVLMPPFVVLEVLSSDAAPARFPVVRAIEHVAFTMQAAELMAPWARPDAVKRLGREVKTSRRVARYDALIVGTARFHRADVLVTLDDDVKALAKLAGVRAVEPKDLLRGAQEQLFAD